MNCDVERRRIRSCFVATQLIVLPDADISDPENESEKMMTRKTLQMLNKKAQHRSWHTAKCNLL